MKQVVRCISLDAWGNILLVRHNENTLWTLPWWHIEEWENLYQAIHREMKEEFNLEITLKWELDEIADGGFEILEYVKPVSVYSISYFSQKMQSDVEKLEYIFLADIQQWEIKVQEEEIYEYRLFKRSEVLDGNYDIYSQVKKLVKKYVK